MLASLYVALPVDSDPRFYWPFIFVLRLSEAALMISLLLTALAMMRNRIAYSTATTSLHTDSDGNVEIRDSGTETTKGMSSSDAVPLMGRNLKRGGGTVRTMGRKTTNKELQQPLMDYSGFGSTVDDDSDTTEFPADFDAGGLVRASQIVKMPQTGNLLDKSGGLDNYVYESGELVWAQYRMDGLFYAARVLGVQGRELTIQYLDYDLTDTLPSSSVVPDHNALLTGERLNRIKAFDSRPSKDMVGGAPEPDTFGLVRLRGKSARKPNHSSLLLKRVTE